MYHLKGGLTKKKIAFSSRTLFMTPAVELLLLRWCSVTHTASRRGQNCSLQLKASTLGSSSTAARKVMQIKPRIGQANIQSYVHLLIKVSVLELL